MDGGIKYSVETLMGFKGCVVVVRGTVLEEKNLRISRLLYTSALT